MPAPELVPVYTCDCPDGPRPEVRVERKWDDEARRFIEGWDYIWQCYRCGKKPRFGGWRPA